MTTDQNIKPSEKSLLVEYEMTQVSAQHHDSLIWTVTNTLWALSMVLLGFAISMLDKQTLIDKLENKILLSSFCFIGITLLCYSAVSSLQFTIIRNQKYNRCKEIESMLELKQHLETASSKYFQRTIYTVLFLFMIAGWFSFLVIIWL